MQWLLVITNRQFTSAVRVTIHSPKGTGRNVDIEAGSIECYCFLFPYSFVVV